MLEGPTDPERDSGMRLDFTLSIGYTRRRSGGAVDRWEARLSTVGLLVIGSIVTLLVLVLLLPRILQALGIGGG